MIVIVVNADVLAVELASLNAKHHSGHGSRTKSRMILESGLEVDCEG
jgi:hypothetical protein